MDKYTKTAGLNYLSENSYKGDGSPGMVMGIASDARGDTNTNEAQKPTTNSKHSGERDLKKYDPTHGHSKPEGGKPQVCHLCKGEGCEPCGHTGEEITKKRNDPQVDEDKKPTTSSKHSTERDLKSYDPAHGHSKPEGGNPDVCHLCKGVGCEPCGHTGEKITKKRNDPKVDEALEDIKRLAGKEKVDESKMGEIHRAATELSKEEFAEEYPLWADEWESVRMDYDSGPKEDDTVHEADGSGSYGGQSPLTYDTQRSSIMKEEDDELNEIARLSGLGEERKRRPDADDYDDFDDEEEKAEDPDKDRVPHILMQVKKALDVDGDHDIQFENGDKHKFSVINLNLFLTKYLTMKPEMREKMQQAAIVGQEEFETIIELLSPKQK